MPSGARTPDELEALLEDASLLGDAEALAALFEDRAVLAIAGRAEEARGAFEIARLAAEIWHRDGTYLAATARILQVHDTALVVAPGGINVVRRDRDRYWRYAISLLRFHRTV